MRSDRSYPELFKAIEQGLKDAKKIPRQSLVSWLSKKQSHSAFIPMHQAMQPITREGLSALEDVGRLWYKNDENLEAVISEDEAARLAVKCFGELLDLDDSQVAKLKTPLLKKMQEALTENTKETFFYFPVRAFEHDDLYEFDVGPVRFERREAWLSNAEDISCSDWPWREEVKEFWATTSEPDYHAPPDDMDSQAKEVVEFASSCEWIASICIKGLHESRAEECARIAVVVALDGSGLELIDNDVATRLRGPSHSLEIRRTNLLSQYPNTGGFNVSTNFDVPILRGRIGNQKQYVDETIELRDAVGLGPGS